MAQQRHRTFVSSILAITILSFLFQVEATVSYQIHIPTRARSEGRLTLELKDGSQTSKRHLSFSETIDKDTSRYKLSIGPIGDAPRVYYKMGTNPILTVQNNQCQVFRGKGQVVPEIASFTSAIFPNKEIAKHLKDVPFLVGPTGLNIVFSSMSSQFMLDLVGQKIYRNLLTDLYTRTLTLSELKLVIKIDCHMMESLIDYTVPAVLNHSEPSGLFSIIVSAWRYTGSKPPSNFDTPADFVYTVDMFQVEEVGDSVEERIKLDYEFRAPLAVGCSDYLDNTVIGIRPQSFSLSSMQRSEYNNLVKWAFDDRMNLLRRERTGKTVSIWDINEEVLYQINTGVDEGKDPLFKVKFGSCSVLDISKVSSQVFRPFRSISTGRRLNSLEILGLNKPLTYMGPDLRRSIPCDVYESILAEPPPIFGAASGDRDHMARLRMHKNRFDFILQYCLARGSLEDGSGQRQTTLQEKHFSPIQIVLYQRDKSNLDIFKIELADVIDIQNFRWSLYGWDKQPGEMFSASECFYDDEEQVEMEMGLKLYRNQGESVEERDDRLLIDHNKIKFAYDLTNGLAEFYHFSKVHMIEYSVQFGTDNQADLTLVVGDRREMKRLFALNSNFLKPNCDAMEHCYELWSSSLSDCTSASSLVEGVNSVVFCPGYSTKCYLFTGRQTPEFQSRDPNSTEPQSCMVYQFEHANPPKRATAAIMKPTKPLTSYVLNFDALRYPPESETSFGKKEYDRTVVRFTGKIEQFDVSHHVKEAKLLLYRFLDTPQSMDGVKVFRFDDIGECMKLCNLDSDCRSYSYCHMTKECAISGLDITGAALGQLLSAQPEGTKGFDTRLSVDDNHANVNYSLELSEGCNIYERNYMSAFSRTNEFVRLPEKLVNRIPKVDGHKECAKFAISVEKDKESLGGQFAYCAQSNACVLDENLFSRVESAEDIVEEDAASNVTQRKEVPCSVYRRRYQTYFHVSSKIMPPQTDQQVELAASTVEECARVCWHQLGQVCASFDYCSPASCRVNQIATSSAGKLISEPGCLHYEMDSKMDELRRANLIGGHQPLLVGKWPPKHVGWRDYFIWLIISIAFGIGLVLGDRLDIIAPQSIIESSSAATTSILAKLSGRFRGPDETGGAGEAETDGGMQLEVIKSGVASASSTRLYATVDEDGSLMEL